MRKSVIPRKTPHTSHTASRVKTDIAKSLAAVVDLGSYFTFSRQLMYCTVC